MFQIYAGDSLVYEPGDMNLALLTPKLTLEMGKAGSLEFTVPAGHPYIDILKKLTSPVAVDLDGERIFRGRVLSGSRTFYNQREVYCEGVLSYLVDSVQKAEKFSGKTHDLFRNIIKNHNARMPAEKQFTVGEITVPDQDIFLLGQSADVDKYDYTQIAINSIVDNWNTTYDYIETCLISYCGGYLMTRQENGVNYIDWIKDYTNTATQEIVFGENLLDLTDETSAEDIFTVLIPLGDNNLTVKKVNNNSDEIVDAAKVAKYGRIIRTNVFSNVSNAKTLLENGQRYLANNGDAPTTLTLTAIDLHNVYPEISAIHLGDRVYIRSDPHDLSQYLTCTKIEYDLEKPENTAYTFGREKQTLTQRYKENKRKSSDTYGNDATGGGGIGASTAEEAGNWHWLDDNISEETDEKIEASEAAMKDEIDGKLSDFYDAWINVNPDQGTVNLGATYKLIQDTVTVLEHNVGIDLDAPQGTINIFADITNISNTLNAVAGMFANLSVSDWARFARLIYSPKVYAGGFYVDDGTEGSGSLNLATHYHKINVDSNNKLYLGPPTSNQDHTDIGMSVIPVFGA